MAQVRIRNVDMEDKTEVINKFFEGRDPLERIVGIECSYNNERASVIYWDENGQKRVRMEDFKPFVWAKDTVTKRMFGGDRGRIKRELDKAGIWVKGLKTSMDGSDSKLDRLANGYRWLFYARRKMSYTEFMRFFQYAGTPIYPKKKTDSGSKEFLAVSPVEQHMMYTGKRMFKGYDNYDDIKRLVFDLETTGLRPEKDMIDQIGIRTNKGFEDVIEVLGEGQEKWDNELKAINKFFYIISQEWPDVIAGQNSEKFDFPFIEERCKQHGLTMEEVSQYYFNFPFYKKKKEAVLKLGGEVEYYRPTVAWGFTIIDSMHAIRRAQASDSSMEEGGLKYVTKYLHLEKKNRVYVPGNSIGKVWLDTDDSYAFNNENGEWYFVDDSHPLRDGFVKTSGRYIVKRYLLDDLDETDKVELKLNECNFLIGKMIPTTFQRACTMGTAGIWKLIVLEWSLVNGLAIPAFGKNCRFTGGLSRLLKTGYVKRVVKLDYNSLYPSIILTFMLENEFDISGILLAMLEYVLTQREKYKQLKKTAGKNAEKVEEQIAILAATGGDITQLLEMAERYRGEEAANDKKQSPLKTLGNSYFGSNGAPNVFPFGNTMVAEKTTCIGRMQLRLMISHFSKLGYKAIVGDSFTGDTPVFVKYGDGTISVKPIMELIDDKKVEVDSLGREYDCSRKPYKVLCRSGWMEPEYIYRHHTDKDLYRITDTETGMVCCVTEDHSLFNSNMKKVSPLQLKGGDKLEYYHGDVLSPRKTSGVTIERAKAFASLVACGHNIDKVDDELLNGSIECCKAFIKCLEVKGWKAKDGNSKRLIAGINYIKKRINDEKENCGNR